VRRYVAMAIEESARLQRRLISAVDGEDNNNDNTKAATAQTENKT